MDYEQVLISALTGGLAGAFAAHWLVIWREKAGRRLAFRNTLSVFIAELQDADDDGVIHYTANRRTVLIECAKISRDIRRSKRYGFERAQCDYCGLEKRENQLPMRRHVARIAKEMGKADEYPMPPEDSRAIKQKMMDALQKLKDCAD